MKRSLRVLITNNELVHRQGSELFVRDIARGLVRRGHCPVAYSTTLGEVADEMHRLTIPVIDDLDHLQEPPDVIHAQHHLDAMTAMLHFPDVPVIYYCHGWLPWQELPTPFPTVARYVAVDDLCRERLLTTPGIAANAVRTLYNFVDLKRFSKRTELPKKPRTALIFSNASAEALHARTIMTACEQAGIERVDHIGLGVGKSQSHPETILPNYDVVFAKARCALEALASGCAVVVADQAGLGGLVTSDNLIEFRRLNFGVRSMQAQPITEAGIVQALAGYCPDDAKTVTDRIREDADLETYLDDLVELYHQAIEHAPSPESHRQHLQAASQYLRGLAPLLKRHRDGEHRAGIAEAQAIALQQHVHIIEQELSQQNQNRVELQDRLSAAEARIAELEHNRQANEARTAELEHNRQACEARMIPLEASDEELRHIQNSRSWKWLVRALKIKNRIIPHRPRRAA